MDMANRTGDKLLITSAMKKIELLNALIWSSNNFSSKKEQI